MSNNRYSGVDSYAAFFIAYKVKLLIRTPLFNASDYEDLEQDLMLAYLYARPSFDCKKGHLKSFIKAAVNNHAKNILIEAERQKRWTGEKDISFQMVSEENPSSTLLDETMSDDGFCGDVFSNLSIASIELELDIQTLLERMPADLKQTFHLLQKYSVTDAGKVLNIPRTTMSSRAKRLRKYMEEELLKK